MSRVLFVISTLEGGGAERVLSNIVTHFPDNWYIDILVNSKESVKYPYKGNILSLSLPKIEEKKSPLNFLTEVVKRTVHLKKLKKENHYDACISFLPSSNISNVLSGNKYCKTIVSIHSSVIDDRFGFINKIFAFFFFRVLYIHTDKIVTVSKEIRTGLMKHLRLPEDKVDTIVNGYDGEWIREQIKHFHDNEKNNNIFAKEQKTVVTVGRIVTPKGQWHLIRAFSEVVKKEPKAKLIIIGEGELEKYLMELVDLYGLWANVIFTGYIDNPFWYLASADIFVLPSLFEGYPNVLIEAIFCGVPCIGTDVHTGVREILAPGLDAAGERVKDMQEEEYGILIPVCSGQKYKHNEPLESAEQKMADAIVMLLRDREKRMHYTQKSIERSEELELRVIVRKWINIILK